jgi:hypothetical protein
MLYLKCVFTRKYGFAPSISKWYASIVAVDAFESGRFSDSVTEYHAVEGNAIAEFEKRMLGRRDVFDGIFTLECQPMQEYQYQHERSARLSLEVMFA